MKTLVQIAIWASVIILIHSFSVDVSDSGSYKVLIREQPWLESAATFLRNKNELFSTEDNTLFLLGSVNGLSGKDVLGSWDMVKMMYGTTKNGPSLMDVEVKSYRERDVVVLSQTFPHGLHNTTSGDMNKVISSFPSFSVNADGSLGMLSFGGLFAGHEGLSTSRFVRGINISDGMSSGPLVLFNKYGDSLIVSSFSEFMSASLWHDRRHHSLHWGIMGKAYRVPPGFSVATILSYSSNGINKAVAEWGEVLRIWYKKGISSRMRDVTINYLGYYTDNGAYYYHNTGSFHNYEEVLLAILEDAGRQHIPYKYLQYDDWWYYITGPGYGATVRWEAMPQIFPHGLKALYNKTGLPVIAHNRFWSSITPYAKQNGGKFNFITYQLLSLPAEQKFWDWLFDEAIAWGMVTYEQDWLNYQSERIFQLHSDVKMSSRWLKQMGAAARARKVTLQYCMALPRHVLQSLEIPSVSQARVSIDYHLHDDQWRIGISSMFAHAVGLAPFKDNFWTVSQQPGNPYNKTEHSPLLQAIVSILSTGPVAPSDAHNTSNPQLIRRLHRADGLLLKPGKPALAIDSQIYQDISSTLPQCTQIQMWENQMMCKAVFPWMAFSDGSGPIGEVWSTTTELSGLQFGIIFAANLDRPYRLGPSLAGFGPQKQPRKSFTVVNEGGAPSSIPGDFSDSSPLALISCTITQPCLVYSSPVLVVRNVPVVIGGELAKVVPVSPQRTLEILVSSKDIKITMSGSPGEDVKYWFYTEAKWISITCHLKYDRVQMSLYKRRCFSV